MASHGKRRHLKRLAAPKSLPIPAKTHLYLVKPAAGRHEKKYSMALLVLLRDVLKLASDKREAKLFLSKGDVLVDGKPVKAAEMPLGLMDVVSIPKLGVHYRLVIAHGLLKPVAIDAKEAGAKLCKLTHKRLIKGGRMQLAFHDGRTQLIEREEDNFRVGDTIKLAIPKQEMAGFLKLEKHARCYVFRGKHSGETATLEEIKVRPGSKASDAFLKEGGKQIITRKDYLFVVPPEFKSGQAHSQN